MRRGRWRRRDKRLASDIRTPPRAGIQVGSLPFVLGGGRAEAEAVAHALAASFPLLRRQVFKALFHATADIRATGTV